MAEINYPQHQHPLCFRQNYYIVVVYAMFKHDTSAFRYVKTYVWSLGARTGWREDVMQYILTYSRISCALRHSCTAQN